MIPLALFGTGFLYLMMFVLAVIAIPIYVIVLLARIAKNTKPPTS